MSRTNVSADAKQWILNRMLAGAGSDQVVAELMAAGWQRKAATDALAVVVAENPRARVAVAANDTPAEGMPEPGIAQMPLSLDAGDREVQVLIEMKSPRVVVFGNLLGADECAALIEAAKPRMARSETVNRQTGEYQIDVARTSRGMFFQRGESELHLRIENRIAKLLNWPAENGEGLQVLHYQPGAEYEPHYDYFDPADPGTPALTRRGGQRVASLIIYLNTPSNGGATTFPDVGLSVLPQCGNAVFFSYPQPQPSTKTLHAGAPVVAGEKWIATKWLRQRVFA
ncbi:MAG: 2OG-Fe(II) oxygenase [Rudaea sp.]|uniref:2OG-Fe(II) oxygenase n=1 Tax=Rudaea sp. TaxID=2136325 RepID=UPI0039E52C1F